MTNRFGKKLDRNGYADSLLQNGDGCWMCGYEPETLQRHEIFGGPFRRKSKELGLWVLLCAECHHNVLPRYPDERRTMQAAAQIAAMLAYDWTRSDFIREFGKNYLEEEIKDA